MNKLDVFLKELTEQTRLQDERIKEISESSLALRGKNFANAQAMLMRMMGRDTADEASVMAIMMELGSPPEAAMAIGGVLAHHAMQSLIDVTQFAVDCGALTDEQALEIVTTSTKNAESMEWSFIAALKRRIANDQP